MLFLSLVKAQVKFTTIKFKFEPNVSLLSRVQIIYGTSMSNWAFDCVIFFVVIWILGVKLRAAFLNFTLLCHVPPPS